MQCSCWVTTVIFECAFYKNVLNGLILLSILVCNLKGLIKLSEFSQEKNVVTMVKFISAGILYCKGTCTETESYR